MLIGTYKVSLVIVSVLVAMLASYTALSLAGRVVQSQGRTARWWIAGGAFAMGAGIWAMHFIGMLAFRLPIPLGYDLGITLLSLLIPVAVSGAALWLVSQPALPFKRLAAGALLMGIGINSMHYTGMAAMRMSPGIVFDPALFAASVVIAILASGGALWMAFRLRWNTPHVIAARAGSAVVMGMAIVGMHYTGMAAASFPLGSVCRAAPDGFSQDGLAILVIVATMAVLTVALIASLFDARLESRTKVLALSEAIAEERQVLLERERIARAQAERVSEMKDEFLATLSHELRTPLNAILGWAQLLRMKQYDKDALEKGLETIERNALAQSKLIEDLLDMSRIISGQVRVETQIVDPISVINTALETIRPATLAKQIQVSTEFSPGIGSLVGDPNRLQQVMWNLLSNAVKFTPAGGRIIVMARQQEASLVIEVIDSGIGIAPEFLPHVFDRFRQADASTTRRFGGLGLGLAIVKTLAELHGGTVQVSSPGKDKGTTFTLQFPVYQADKDFPSSASLPHATIAGISLKFQPVDLTGLRAVVIDDDADALNLVATILGECGATALTATNAKQALALIGKERPDVIISDIGMPDHDGFSLIQWVRQLAPEQGGNTPAIALTAFSRAEDRKRALKAGFNHYLSKPVDAGELISILGKLTTTPVM
ncbi:NO-binding membrane sensor protein with MHYT domain [Paucimonas lemoignei]|uniref:Virulence sensor protein BvgS n=1 Tax=Paucimonas lemoignei TaxID=29443 RepID=A0A4R3HNU2_PAULE|nr:MHYT domain-containing protein [Paucimonas lemoignei]TCS32602.1 NO-binding membrane sensor protein with MHYT domain [Paucimonas lemoignei]